MLLVGILEQEDILLPNTLVSSCIGGPSHHNSYVFLVVYAAEGTAPGTTVSNTLICWSLFGAVQTALHS